MKGTVSSLMENKLPMINPVKIHRKADEINKLLDERYLLNKTDKITITVIVIIPKIFCLKKNIL